MKKSRVIQNLGIAIAIKNQNPSILTHDFLKYSDVVSPDWEIARASQIVLRDAPEFSEQEILITQA